MSVDLRPYQTAALDEIRDAMGMPWAKRRHGITEAIPPAFTECVGRVLLEHLGVAT